MATHQLNLGADDEQERERRRKDFAITLRNAGYEFAVNIILGLLMLPLVVLLAYSWNGFFDATNVLLALGPIVMFVLGLWFRQVFHNKAKFAKKWQGLLMWLYFPLTIIVLGYPLFVLLVLFTHVFNFSDGTVRFMVFVTILAAAAMMQWTHITKRTFLWVFRHRTHLTHDEAAEKEELEELAEEIMHTFHWEGSFDEAFLEHLQLVFDTAAVITQQTGVNNFFVVPQLLQQNAARLRQFEDIEAQAGGDIVDFIGTLRDQLHASRLGQIQAAAALAHPKAIVAARDIGRQYADDMEQISLSMQQGRTGRTGLTGVPMPQQDAQVARPLTSQRALTGTSFRSQQAPAPAQPVRQQAPAPAQPVRQQAPAPAQPVRQQAQGGSKKKRRRGR